MRILCLVRLLEDPQVVEEIERYKWLESERRGFNIGEKAATIEWIRAYGCHWLKAHKRDKYQAMLEELCKEEDPLRSQSQHKQKVVRILG